MISALSVAIADRGDATEAEVDPEGDGTVEAEGEERAADEVPA
jgi:hypothetical protein